ncbi:MAG: hypothetical protein ACI4KR_10345 [Ruminiclostridium sp.]
MELIDVKRNLNRRIRVKDRHIDGEYILTACIIRRNESGDFFYQAEVQDLNNHRSVCIVRLEDVSITGIT